MKIEVQHIPSQGIIMDVQREAHTFGGLTSLMAEEGVDFLSPVEISLKIRPERDMIRVDGKLGFTLQLVCSRCLGDFENRIAHDFTLRFSRRIPQDVHYDDQEGVEVTAEQIGLIFFEDDQIDLTDTVREQIILALPYRPICNADCKGLCPGCGADLNKATCTCDQRKPPGPFDILKTLK